MERKRMAVPSDNSLENSLNSKSPKCLLFPTFLVLCNSLDTFILVLWALTDTCSQYLMWINIFQYWHYGKYCNPLSFLRVCKHVLLPSLQSSWDEIWISGCAEKLYEALRIIVFHYAFSKNVMGLSFRSFTLIACLKKICLFTAVDLVLCTCKIDTSFLLHGCLFLFLFPLSSSSHPPPSSSGGVLDDFHSPSSGATPGFFASV